MADRDSFEVVPRDEAGYLLVDADWRIVAANESGSLTADGGSASLLGRHVRDVIGAEALARLQNYGSAILSLDNMDHVLTVSQFALPGGGMLRVLRAQEMQATLEHVVSLIVHEVRNPLSAMRALVQGLEEEVGGAPECLAYTQRLTGEIDRLNRLLMSMGQVARLRSRPPVPLNPNAVLERIAEVFRNALERRGIHLHIAATPRAGPFLADPDQVQQMLVNLVTNAADAMPNGGTLTLRARLDPRGRTMLSVEDTGAGMDSEMLERALRPRQSSKPGGMGLGLTIVRGIVRQHGGQMRVSSAPGQGTTISITFPSLPGEPSKVSTSEREG
ncbi:MAG TPA: ATP-binding protein [Ktedonobacterales bacterium]|nr:ATP-binding protein [Ktedonobacterales bacterium]